MRQRTGIFLNGLGAAISLGAAFIPETVTSGSGGVLPLNVLMLFAAAGFALRAGGFSSARRNGTAGMAWAARILSWVVFAVPGVMLGLTGSPFAIAALGAFVVLDAAGGLAAKDADAPAPKKARKGGIWKRMKAPLVIGLYLTSVALIHFSVSIYLPFGVLLTWSLLALGFALLLRSALVGPKATQEELRAPPDHRRHERHEELVTDPQLHLVEGALQRARKKGDAGALVQLARQMARMADLPEEQARAMEQRIQDAASQRALRTDADARALLDELEALLNTPAHRAPSPSSDKRPPEASA